MKAEFKRKRSKRSKQDGGYKRFKTINISSKPETEYKYDDIGISLGFNNTGTIAVLNGSTLGSDFNARVGRKIQGKSLEIRCQILPSGAYSQSFLASARIAIVYDRSPNGAYPAYSDIFQDTGGTVNNLHSMPNVNNKDRFLILRDETFMTQPTNLGAQLGPGYDVTTQRYYHRFIKLHNLSTHFKDANSGISSFAVGAIYVVCFADQASNTYILFGTARHTYLDK